MLEMYLLMGAMAKLIVIPHGIQLIVIYMKLMHIMFTILYRKLAIAGS
jgi:hypothetical protein